MDSPQTAVDATTTTIPASARLSLGSDADEGAPGEPLADAEEPLTDVYVQYAEDDVGGNHCKFRWWHWAIMVSIDMLG